ncbi:MAG: sulfatase [Planctomycetota bacterium]
MSGRRGRGRLCVGAALFSLGALLAGCGGDDSTTQSTAAARFPQAPVLLISIDTLRADRLGSYGYERNTSPALDAFAREAVRFEQAYATSCKTAESHMSLFTSLPSSAHGVSNASLRLEVPLYDLARNRTTWPQLLRRAGYWNAAVAGGGNLDPRMGFDRGFEGRFRSELQDVSSAVDDALALFDLAAQQPKPSFVFLHTYQVHGPYAPPREFRKQFVPQLHGRLASRVAALEDLPLEQQGGLAATAFWDGVESFGPEEAALCSDLYDGEVAYTDRELGRLFAALKERGIYDRLLIIVLSDHGEEFAEHGHYEHDQLYRESLHVPLLLRLPGGALGGRSVAEPVSLLDVLPTLLELLDLERPEQLMGQSLVPALSGSRLLERPLLAERTMFAGAYMATLRHAGELIYFRERESRLEGYDTGRDPAELVDLRPAADAPPAAALRQQLTSLFALRAVLDAEARGEAITLSPEALEELQQLNYTGGVEDLPLPKGTPLESWPTR